MWPRISGTREREKKGKKKKRDGYQNGTLYTPKYILCTSTYRYLVLLYSLALCIDIDIWIVVIRSLYSVILKVLLRLKLLYAAAPVVAAGSAHNVKDTYDTLMASNAA